MNNYKDISLDDLMKTCEEMTSPVVNKQWIKYENQVMMNANTLLHGGKFMKYNVLMLAL